MKAMNSNDRDLFEKFKKIAASYNCIKKVESFPKEKGKFNLMKKKIIATACASLILVSGIVFAINSKKANTTDRGLGKGVETAIENGYIANPEMDFMDFDDKGTKIKVENFLMDDFNLSINFLIKFDENKINVNKISNINLNKLVIRDEENKIIFEGFNPEFFEKYCRENNLDYRFGDFDNDNIIGCGLSSGIEKQEENILRLTYNLYVGNCNFPKSKKLYISLGNLKIHEFENGTDNEYELQGNWNVEIDVPENMYNRTSEEYRMVSCSNKNFNVYKAMVTETRLELGFIVSNAFVPNGGKINNRSLYIVNEYGNKFYTSYNAGRIENANFSDDKMTCNNYKTFEMTKFNVTDKIYVIISYYGIPVVIELERVK